MAHSNVFDYIPVLNILEYLELHVLYAGDMVSWIISACCQLLELLRNIMQSLFGAKKNLYTFLRLCNCTSAFSDDTPAYATSPCKLFKVEGGGGHSPPLENCLPLGISALQT